MDQMAKEEPDLPVFRLRVFHLFALAEPSKKDHHSTKHYDFMSDICYYAKHKFVVLEKSSKET